MFEKKSSSMLFKLVVLLATSSLIACAESKSKPAASKDPAPSAEANKDTDSTNGGDKTKKTEENKTGSKADGSDSPPGGEKTDGEASEKEVVRIGEGGGTTTTKNNSGKATTPKSKIQPPPSEEAQNSLQIRRNAWGNLLAGGDMVTKMKEARVYISNFEFFQAQKNNSFTNDNQRNELLQQAAQDFLLEAEGIALAEGKIDVFAKPESQDLQGTNNKTASFNALAVSIGASDLGIKEDSKSVSFESLIAQSLASKNKDNPPGALSEVLLHEETSIQIMQTRHNLLVWWFLARVTKYDELYFYEKWWNKYWSWDLDLNQYNSVQLDFFLKQYLEPALKTKSLLTRAGIKVTLDSRVSQLLKNMKLKQTASKDEKTGVLRSRITQVLAELAKN